MRSGRRQYGGRFAPGASRPEPGTIRQVATSERFMRRLLLIGFVSVLGLAGCNSGVSQAEHDQTVAELALAQQRLAVLIPEVVDAVDGWSAYGGVVSVVIVLVEPVGEVVGALLV